MVIATKEKLLALCCSVIFSSVAAFGQTGRITGIVKDKLNDTAIAGAFINIEGTSINTTADSSGRFQLSGVPAQSYNITALSAGYDVAILYNVVVSSGNEQNVTFMLEGTRATDLKEVVIRKNPFIKSAETPLSIQSLSAQEIRSNPGGNFDVSRVIQAFPGVGGTSGSVGGYRNDLIIRGGAPNENVYYLDGIEVPVINHFATQGSAGGPTGIINISFIQDVNLYTSAFPAAYDNPLSGILQMKSKEASPDKVQSNVRLSASEVAFSSEGPLNSKMSYQASARRSYLQLLFSLLELPIQPSYWDFQFRVNYKINKKLSLYAMGIGAIDKFSFLIPGNLTPENIYILSSNPFINQWSYTNGYGLKKLVRNGLWNLTLSRNMLNNRLDKYQDNRVPVESQRTLKINSVEAETKLRFDVKKFYKVWSYSYGAMAQYDKYSNDFLLKYRSQVLDANGNVIQPAVYFKSNTDIDLVRYGAFAQLSGKFLDENLTISGGARIDGNSFMTNGKNPFNQFSPRMALSYQFIRNFKFNASVGRYFKVPTYTVMGYTDTNGNYLNRSNGYIKCEHLVAGLEYLPNWQGARFTVEAFYKRYVGYPVSLRDSISLANKGGDFSVLGNEPVSDAGKGRAYGLELQFQQKLTQNLFAVIAYTHYKSEFTNINGKYSSASWDNGSLISFIGGYKFKRNIELGIKFRYQGGAPYSPFDMVESQANYSTLGTGVLDYGRFNTLRLASFHSMDIRIDKKWNYKRWALDLFLDVTNAYAAKQPATPNFTFKRTEDNKDFLTTDGQALRSDGSNAIPLILDNSSGTVIPTIGFIAEF